MRSTEPVDADEPRTEIGSTSPEAGAGPLAGPKHPGGEVDTAEMPALDLTPRPNRSRPAPCLVVTDLSVEPIFADVSFTAGRGELVAVVGDAGIGRSSLLLSIAGRFRFDAGQVTVDGRSEPGYLRSRVAVARAGEVIAPDPHHTVDQLMAETVLAGCPADIAEIREVAELLGVAVDGEETFGRLPAVDQTLLAVAFAAAERTPVIAVDDVDAGLGNTAAACVWAALRVLADNDHVVVATSLRPDLSPDTIIRIGRKQALPAGIWRNGEAPTVAAAPDDPAEVDPVGEEPL